MTRTKYLIRLVMAAATMLLLTTTGVAANSSCQYVIYTRACEWDYGCWANPLTPDGQWWTTVECVRSDGSTTVLDRYESGGCCSGY